MDTERIHRALKETARQQGVTEEEVISEIEAAIAEAIVQARRNQDKDILAEWEKIPCEGEFPNVYEIIAYIGGKIAED